MCTFVSKTGHARNANPEPADDPKAPQDRRSPGRRRDGRGRIRSPRGFGLRLSSGALAVSLVILRGLSAHAAAPVLSDLKAYPPEINLSSAKARQRIVVQATYSDGLTRDITTEATSKLTNSKVAKLDKAVLTPITDGKTELQFSFKGRSVAVPITSTNAN